MENSVPIGANAADDPGVYKHFNVSQIRVLIDGNEVKSCSPLQMDFDNNNYTEAYYQTLTAHDKRTEKALQMTMDEYKNQFPVSSLLQVNKKAWC